MTYSRCVYGFFGTIKVVRKEPHCLNWQHAFGIPGTVKCWTVLPFAAAACFISNGVWSRPNYRDPKNWF